MMNLFKTILGKDDWEYTVDVFYDSGIGDPINEGAYADFSKGLIKRYTEMFNRLPSVGEIIRDAEEDYIIKNVCINNDTDKVEVVVSNTEWLWD